MQVLGTAREDRAVDEIANVVRRDAAVAHHLVRARIERDHAVEDAREWRGIQLQKKFLHGLR